MECQAGWVMLFWERRGSLVIKDQRPISLRLVIEAISASTEEGQVL